MAFDPSSADFACELFAELGAIKVKPMFGGAALYIDDAMFAMIINDQIFMKAGAELIVAYQAAGSVPFSYDTKKGRRSIAGLTSLPESAVDDADEAMTWAKRSLVDARITAQQKREAKAAKAARASQKVASALARAVGQ
ncbi:MAG: TfoX/Sxy family protein [Rhodobacteraceae bacterium]|nr:TfoX/Sxy family protein [Paracoccaceae bacterium]